MPVFKEKQWILIIANFIAKFFDIMNPYYSGDIFLPTISAVIYNFKVLFAATYGNSSSFNIGNFESRFVPAPKVNFRCVFHRTLPFYKICTSHQQLFGSFS